LIYPKTIAAAESNYTIALYHPCEKIKDAAGNLISEVKAVGYCLPTADNLRYEMKGRWSRNAKHGVQFEVEGYSEVIIPTKEGIIAYLCSGQIKGIGPKTAEKIYAAFGVKTLDVLDTEPEKLLSISGISQNKLSKICDSYLASRGARDVVAFLAPHGVTPNRAVKLYKQYGEQTMDIVRNHPYRLCEMVGIGFKTADRIAMSMGFDRLSPERVDEGMLFTLVDAELKGHLCMEKHSFIKQCLKLLDTEGLTEEMAAARAVKLLENGRLTSYKGQIYRASSAKAEQNLAWCIKSMLASGSKLSSTGVAGDIEQEEKRLGLELAAEQREAVSTALSSRLSVITGGPGTGKTLIQRVLLNIYRRRKAGAKIVCCAPTGRAARRMEQSTGVPATTIHKALGLLAGEDGDYCEPQMLDADLVVVDEVSMMDVYLAGYLFRSVPRGCQMVLIGDADQLPSVGPGAVLSEIIGCGAVALVRLDRIYRQSYGSRIASNAKLIRHGNLSLEYGEDFQFFDSNELTASADMLEDLYLQETARYGVDNVALLTPYRQKTETGVNALNERLREKINPSDRKKPEVTYGKRTFRLGDKVMQTRNHDDVNNGDIGYITGIVRDGGDSSLHVDFGDGHTAEYESSDLDMLDLAYASTIHKSQGSEYKSVIINLQCAHAVMLVRPLIYTAITRAKERVLIVGERRAVCIAIKRTDTEQRGTMLAKRIQSAE
jgi:exodeoxyribonuclease V alpha subunit